MLLHLVMASVLVAAATSNVAAPGHACCMDFSSPFRAAVAQGSPLHVRLSTRSGLPFGVCSVSLEISDGGSDNRPGFGFHSSWNDSACSINSRGSAFHRSCSDSTCSVRGNTALFIGEGLNVEDGAFLRTPLAKDGRNVEGRTSNRLADQLRLVGHDKQRLSYSQKFVIRCYEVGVNKTASIETIANLLQEVSCNHAQSVGFSIDGFATTPSMRRLRLIWVTTRMHIEMDEYPVWGDTVEIETWCQSEKRLGIRRDWLLTNVANGKIIGRATSTWVMMNQDTRRLARITDDIREEYMIFCPDPPRWAFNPQNNCSLKKIPKLQYHSQFKRSGLMPKRSELDMNQHVNNVTYIGWILESIPQAIIDTHWLYRITLDYRQECRYIDVVESLASLESFHEMNSLVKSSSPRTSTGEVVNGRSAIHSSNSRAATVKFLHMLCLAGSEVEINKGRTEWKMKEEKRFATP